MSGTARAYLDWNASAPLRPEARAAMASALDLVGNPSSPHQEGRAARAAIERAREQIALLVGAPPGEVALTSGATEAVNWAVKGRAWDALILAAGEHASARAAAEAASSSRDVPLLRLDATKEGAPAGLEHSTLDDFEGAALFIGWEAQGETGAAAAPEQTNTLAAAMGALAFTDATQLAGKAAFNAAGDARAYRFETEFAAISAHKFGGPKGVGALLMRGAFDIPPLVHGGGQELRRRSGTENLAGIVGMGAAAEAALRDVKDGVWEAVREKRDRLQSALLEETPGLAVIAADAPWRLANTLTVAAPGAKAESLLIRLDMAGVAVSAGSACSSGKMSASPVLAAMGLSPKIAEAAVRISLGPTTTEAELEAFLGAWRGLKLKAQ